MHLVDSTSPALYLRRLPAPGALALCVEYPEPHPPSVYTIEPADAADEWETTLDSGLGPILRRRHPNRCAALAAILGTLATFLGTIDMAILLPSWALIDGLF